MDLQRKDGESKFQYHKRIVEGKLVDKTLSDIDYSELSELVYGKQYASDVARRMMYGSKRTLELLDEETLLNMSSESEDEELDRLEDKILELKMERQKFRDQRREFNKLVSASGRDEYLKDRIVEAANKVNETFENLYDEVVHVSKPNGKNSAVLVFSDWHYGMTTDNIYNKYNSSICKQRVKEVTQKAIDRAVFNECNELHVVVLGDLFHGAIHTGVRVASDELVCDQMMNVSEILAQSLIYMSRFMNKIYVHMTYGNHARTVQNKKDSIHRDNMERVIRWWLEQRLANYENIIISAEPRYEILFLEVCNHGICAAHGDLDSVKGSPKLLHTLLQKNYDIDFEYLILGDKHHYERFDELGITSVICGSLCGTDDYANEKRLYSDPSQLLLIVNEKEGIDAEYKLKC